jgi:hypothetical protein
MDTVIYDYFGQLASLDADERQKAAYGLITHLHDSYQKFIKSEEEVSEINVTGYYSIEISTP